MGKSALIIVAGLSLTLSSVNSRLNERMVDATELAISSYEKVMAQQVARSAVNNFLARLCLTPALRGTFVEENRYLTNSRNTVVITGGNSTTNPILLQVSSEHGTQIHRIKVRAQLFSKAVPPAFQYSCLSDGDLQLNGEVRIQLAPELSNLNADIHTNGNLKVNGATNSVAGFGTYAGNVSASPPGVLNDTFDPLVDPANLTDYGKGPYVEVPLFKAETYASLATTTINGDLTLTSLNAATLFGTSLATPKICYITGNLSVSGNVSFTENVIFLVKGNVNITDNSSLTSTNAGLEGKSKIGIYTNGNVEMGGSSTLEAQLFAYGNIIMHGENKLYGSAVADGNIIYKGTADVYYRPANAQLTEKFWPGPLRASIISWYE